MPDEVMNDLEIAILLSKFRNFDSLLRAFICLAVFVHMSVNILFRVEGGREGGSLSVLRCVVGLT